MVLPLGLLRSPVSSTAALRFMVGMFNFSGDDMSSTVATSIVVVDALLWCDFSREPSQKCTLRRVPRWGDASSLISFARCCRCCCCCCCCLHCSFFPAVLCGDSRLSVTFIRRFVSIILSSARRRPPVSNGCRVTRPMDTVP
uniref:Putative secreted protein n=1 Tax=Anopheles darlingi TaxID=43151 RepID=A0A2M4DJL4_ANODA